MKYPFPEGFNRVAASIVADLHFAPTQVSADALLRERVNPERIFVTGNTVIDALELAAPRLPASPIELAPRERLILMTAHRRESFGLPLAEIYGAVAELACRHPDLHFVYPVHPNPNVSAPAHAMLGNTAGVTLCPPLEYGRLATLLQQSWLVLTDSGGLQEVTNVSW